MGAQTIKCGNKWTFYNPSKQHRLWYFTALLFYILATMSLDDSEQQYIYSEIYLQLSTIFTQLS